MNEPSIKMTGCIRCGTCCAKGGPSLHSTDRAIIMSGNIRTEHLITIRKGEVAYTPGLGGPSRIEHEIVKIAGKRGSWECLFFDGARSSCMIYEHRPLECRILKCWDTKELFEVLGKDLLSRSDILDRENPVSELIDRHEKEFPVCKIEDLLSLLSDKDSKATHLKELQRIVEGELDFRVEAASRFELPLSVEMFVFGRPLFKHLNGRGVSFHEEGGRLHLSIS